MRFPALTPHSAGHLPSGFIPNNTPSTANFCFEPTSVLDICRSPSPVQDHFPTASISDVLSQTEGLSILPSIDDHHQQAAVHNLDDWDSIMRELGLHDDFAPSALKANFPRHHSPSNSGVTQFHDLASSVIPSSDHPLVSPSEVEFPDWNSLGFDLVEELIRAADCFDSGELQLAHAMLSRLNQRLCSPVGKPLQRAAFYFKEALNTLLSVSIHPSRSSSLEIVESIRAQKAFSSISPIPMFTDFTANQAVLESIDSATFVVHIVDFEIGLGGQYASLMREIADRSVSSKQSRVSIRITAVVQEEFENESRLVRDNLCQFAHDLQIRFRIDFVSLRTFEMLSEKSIEFTDDEKTIVHLTPITFRRTGAKFVSDLRLIVPNVVILVTSEEWQTKETVSFRRSFVDGLEFYSVLLESLDAAAVDGGAWVKPIEAFVLRRRIAMEVETMGGKTSSWREILAGAGMRPAGLSRLAEFQAECLVRKGEVRGFHVGTRHGELVLSWHGRPLVATSAWKY